MTETYAVLASVALLLALLLWGRVRPALLFTVWAAGYFLLGWVPEERFLAAYTNPALATLVVLLLVSLALERSPWVTKAARGLIGQGGQLAVLRLTAVAAALSAFLNNTAVVAGLMRAITVQRVVPASQLLLPLSYASILGGVVTLVGSSTNLVVNSLVLQAGLPSLGMFTFAWVGLPAAVAGIVTLTLSAKLLPRRDAVEEGATSSYFLEARLDPESPLVGRSIEQNGLRRLEGLFLLEIVRNGRLISPVGPDEVLEPGDLLVFTGEVGHVHALARFPGLRPFDTLNDALLRSNLQEVVLAPQSDLVNRTLREVDFRTLFDAGVVGIRRGERRLTGQLGRIPLRAGDSLLLAVGPDFQRRHNLDRNFYLLGNDPLRPPLTGRANLGVVGGFLAVISAAAAGWFPLLKGLLVLLGLLLLFRILTLGELRRRFPFELWLVIGSALVIAEGMASSGASALLASTMYWAVGGLSPYGALIGIYIFTWLLTELISNAAAAALAIPVALTLAEAINVNPMPFVMVVAYAASAGFLLPSGYQTHLMVFSIGRYRVLDFIRLGALVGVAYAATVLTLVPVFFPFSGLPK